MAKRGFAALTPERRTEISRLGGRAAHAAGTAHRFTPEEAETAGRKGGLARRARSVLAEPDSRQQELYDEEPVTQRVPC